MRRIAVPVHDCLCTFMTIHLSQFFRIRNISDEAVAKIKTKILHSVTFFENGALCEVTWKNIV